MSQSGVQEVASLLQTVSDNLWTFSINMTSRLRIHFLLHNPTEVHHYRVACIILLPRIRFSAAEPNY
jgi:hypothetical protein